MPESSYKFKTIGIVADNTKSAAQRARTLLDKYDLKLFSLSSLKTCNSDLVISLGGDGFMLRTLHILLGKNIPIYGMNCGTIGFLMNRYSDKKLLERLSASKTALLHPLLMKAKTSLGKIHIAHAINEVSLFRETYQTARLSISIDNKVRLKEAACDGILVSTPAGSTAYNFSAGGPIVPLNANLLALTALSPFRPRRWKGALLPHDAKVEFNILDPKKRPVSAVADFIEVRDVTHVQIKEDKTHSLKLLFDPDHGLEERIISEQFST